MEGLILNYYASEAGLPVCSAKTTQCIVQDAAPGGVLWTALGIGSGAYVVVDQSGVLAAKFYPASLPTIAPELEAAVDALLGL